MARKSNAELYEEYKKKSLNKNGGVKSDTSSDRKSNRDLYLSYNAPSKIKELQNRLKLWSDSTNSLISSYKSRYYDEEGNYINQYRTDSSDWFANVAQSKMDLLKESDELRSILDTYKGYIKDNSYAEIAEMLKANSYSVSKIYDSALADNKYWSQFKTAEEEQKYRNEQYLLENRNLKEYESAINDLESFYSEVSKLAEERAGEGAYADVVVRNQLRKRGFESLEELRSHIDGLQDTYNKSYAVQMTNSVDPKSEHYDPSTAEWVEKGNAIKNPTMDEADGWLYVAGKWFGDKEVQNPVTYTRENWSEQEKNPNFSQYSLESRKLNPLYMQMKEEEVNAYSALLAQDKVDGGNRAEKYLTAINETLEQRLAGELSKPFTENPALGIVFDLGYGSVNAVEAMFKPLTNAEGEKSDPSHIDYMPSIIASENNEKWGYLPEIFGTDEEGNRKTVYGAASDTAGTIGYMLPSILAAKLTGGASLALGKSQAVAGTIGAAFGSGFMGLASAGSGYQEMLDLGYSKEQARTYGLMIGSAEALTSYLLSGISEMGGKLTGKPIAKIADKIDNAIGRFAVNIGGKLGSLTENVVRPLAHGTATLAGSIGSEIFEEELQLWLEPAIKKMVLDVDFDAPNLDDMLYTALTTAFSTFLLEAGGTASTEVNAVNKGKNLKSHGDAEVDRLVELGKTFSADTVASQIANKVNKDTGAYTIGRLFYEVGASLSSQNVSDITKALVEKGFTQEQAKVHAKWMNHVVEGGNLTKRQQVALESNPVLSEVLYGTIIQPNSTVMQRTQAVNQLHGIESSMGLDRDTIAELTSPEAITQKLAYKRVMGEEIRRGANPRKGLSAEQISEIDNIAAAIASIEKMKKNTAETIDKSSYEVSASGQMVNTATGDTIEPQGLVQAEDGTYMIAAKDAEPVSRADVSYADDKQALVYETFLTLEDHSGKISKVLSDMDLESRNALLGIYNPEVNESGSEFVNGVFEAFFYGHRGIDMSTAGNDSPMMSLTKEQRQIAWNTGRTAGIQSTTKAQSNVDIVYAEAKKALEQSGVSKGNYHASLAYDISPMQLNSKQKAVYSLADEIAKGVQSNIRIYAGKNKAHGFYNHATDEIWLNLNAANTSREAIMAFTLGHELVHRAKGSPAKYQSFVDFLMKEYGKQGSNIEAMIAQELAAAEEFDKHAPADQKINMTREQALEEVVCDACQRMLLDTNAGQKLAEFGAQSKQNKSFLDDLKRWISELLDKLRNYFKGVEPDSLAAKEFAKFDADVKQILADMYVDMSIDAGEKLSTIHAAGDAFVEKLLATKDIQYNLELVKTHKDKLQKEFSEDSATDLDTIMKRYNKIIDIWTKLGGELNSKFLNEWNSKVGKDRTFTIFKAQAGYKYNVELSSMCKKGVPLFEAIDTIVKQEVMKELGTNVLGKAEKEILYDILKQHNFEIPCAICYVEQARQREGVIIDAFINGKVDKNSKGKTTKVKLGWNQVLDSIQKEMKANGVDYTFAHVSRDIATEKYSPANFDMDMKTQVAFYAALKKIANKEITRYNKDEAKKGNSRKILSNTTPEAVKECFKGTLPANLKIFKVLFEEPSSRFKIQNDLLYSSVTTQNLSMAHNKLYGLFNSQGGVSGYKTKQGTTIYWGDILGKTWKPDTLRKEGGVRNQSNSDSQMYTLLDQAQMYIDFSAKGYYLQAYTKVLSMLKLFGLSRGKINASLIPKVVVYKKADGTVDIEKTMATAGLDENGNPIYDDIEGINHNEAFMLLEDSEYSKNICGICIGYSDAHILKLLDDPRVQQIIGFHDKTDDGSKRYKGARYAKNYNGLNEAVNKDGKTVHIGFNPYVKKAENKFKYNEETEAFEGTVNYKGKTYTADDIPRLAADLYLEMCDKKGYTPAYKDFANHPNYYKLLADFGLKDSQGHYAPHRKVVYNMPDTVPYLDANGKKQTMKTYDYIKAELVKELAVRDSIAEALADTSSEGIIPQFKVAVKKSQAEKSYSLPKVFADAVEKFGTTTDFAEVGYILPSGEMLKFTDEKHRGERQYDHRAIGMVYGVDVDLGVNHGFNEESGKFLDEFVENGGIRFDAGDPDLDMDAGFQLSSTVPITKAQEQLIRDFVEWKQNREELFEANTNEENFLYEGPLAIRIDFGGDSKYAVGAVSAKDLSAWGKKSLEYDGGNINADRIIADIRHYYETGETRKPSVVSQFHYSYSLPKSDSTAEDFVSHMKGIVKDRGSWRSEDAFNYVTEHPELNFIERIFAKDKQVKADLANYLNEIDDVKTLDLLSWYMGEAYGDKGRVFDRDTWKTSYPYRGAVRTFRNAIKKRITDIMTEQVGGTNLGVKNGDVSLQEISDIFYRLNSNQEIGEFAKKVFATAEKLGVNIRFTNQTFSKGVAGDQVGDMVEYKTSYFNDPTYSDQQKAKTILHELIHTCTTYVLQYNTTAGDVRYSHGKTKNYENIANAATRLNRIYLEIKDDPAFAGKYGIKNAKEMVAELANEDFVALLRKKNLWDQIVDWICELFGFRRGNTAYDNARLCVDFILDNPEASEYKAYAESQRRSARRDGYDVFGRTVLEDGSIRYSLPKTQNQTYRKPAYDQWDVRAALDDALQHGDQGYENLIKVGDIPNFVTDLIGIDGDFYIYRNHAYENMVSKEDAEKAHRPTTTKRGNDIHFHNLGKQRMSDAILSLENPIMTINDSNEFGNPEIVMILPVRGNNDSPLYAAMSFYSNTHINGEWKRKPHIVLTISERGLKSEGGYDGHLEVINKAIANGKVLSFDKEKMRDYLSVIANHTRVGNITSKSLTDNIAHFRKFVNAFREKNGIDYKLPIGEDTSPRTLLAKSLEGAAKTDLEKQKLKEYQSKIDLINSEEKKLRELREQIKEISFSKGKRDTEKLKSLQFEANQAANRINVYDKQLLRLEATQPIANVLAREKEMAKKRQKQKDMQILADYKEKSKATVRELLERNQESRKKAIEGREKTLMRHKIKGVVNDLNQLLLKGTKERNVKLGLQPAVASALKAINMDTVAADDRIAKYDALIAKAKDPDVIASLTETRDRIQSQGDAMKDKLEALREAYTEIEDKGNEIPEYYRAETDIIKKRIESVIQTVGNTPLRNMSLAQLESVYELYSMVLATVRNANKVFVQGKLEDLQHNASATMEELDAIKKRSEERYNTSWADSFSWNEMIPVYAFRRMGSQTFEKFFWEAIRGQNTVARDLEEANNFASEAREKYGYSKWDFNKVHEFKMNDGRTFRITLKHMMSIYAYSKRNQALDHMSKGGFFFNDKETFRKKGGIFELVKKNEVGYCVDSEMLEVIKEEMTDMQKLYVDEMQEYLTKMGEKGNEVSRAVWGIDIFKEKVYFPLKSVKDFIFQANQTAQESSLKNDGMTKETKPGASNPIVLEAFDEVWAKHVNRMSQYHGLVIPIDNLNKIHNYGTWAETDSMSVSTMLGARFGEAVNDYINQFIKDLNGASSTSGATNPFIGFVSKFKKTAVAASTSVMVQQPTAVIRAQAVLDAKYFIGIPKVGKTKWDEIKKYAPIAIIKDIGGFDAGAGRQATDWLNSDTKQGLDKVMNKVDDITMYGAALGDKIGWCTIWEAVKREVKATTNLTEGSKEFLDKVGERFTEVIVLTQVYDSTLSRSGYMRSKHDSVKMLTSFMGEPTVSMNMMFDATVQAKRGKITKRKAGRIIGATYSAMIAASVLASMVYGLRDDDEDESYLEKFAEALGGKLLGDLNPLNMLPGFRDLVSILDGWDVERTDIAIFKDIKDAVNGLDSDSKSAWRKTEDLAGAFASLFGLPLKNVLRTTREIYNAVENIFDDTSPKDVGEAFVRGIAGEKKDKGDELYDAIVSGDKARLEVYRKDYKTDESYETAVKKALRENDPRIKEAAQARIDGDISKYKSIAMSITSERKFSQDLVVGAINAEINAINKKADDANESSDDEDESKATSIYKASDINAALENGDTSAALEVINDLVKVKTENYIAEGEKKKDAEKKARSSVKSSVTSYWKPLYLAAYKSKNNSEMARIRKILNSTKLYDNVVETCQDWVKQSK